MAKRNNTKKKTVTVTGGDPSCNRKETPDISTIETMDTTPPATPVATYNRTPPGNEDTPMASGSPANDNHPPDSVVPTVNPYAAPPAKTSKASKAVGPSNPKKSKLKRSPKRPVKPTNANRVNVIIAKCAKEAITVFIPMKPNTGTEDPPYIGCLTEIRNSKELKAELGVDVVCPRRKSIAENEDMLTSAGYPYYQLVTMFQDPNDMTETAIKTIGDRLAIYFQERSRLNDKYASMFRYTGIRGDGPSGALPAPSTLMTDKDTLSLLDCVYPLGEGYTAEERADDLALKFFGNETEETKQFIINGVSFQPGED